MTNVQKQANKRHGFYIEPFMIDLDLSMTELMCYAVVYNFSKDGKSTFYGGQNYLASQINKSRSTVSEALTKLEQKGLVGKRERDFVGGFEYFVVSRSVNSKCQSTDTLSSGLETKSTPIDTHDGDKNTKASEIDPNISEKTPKEPQQNCQSTDTPFGVPNTYVGEPTSDVGTPNETSRSTELGCRQTDADNKIYINNNKLNKNESVERTHAKPPSHRSKLVQTL
ncbi:MAG: helix-turn-helix domain-containing protein, partial [Firmicutes bacterium]|nr:helix-turn-helix domain-containing protein [Bacillota bacterium]